MKRNVFPLVIIFLLFVKVLAAQQNDEPRQKNILETLAAEDSATHAKVKIHQDRRIDSLLTGKKKNFISRELTSISGYRVQVFSSNTQRTAKNEAFQKEQQIKDMFPDLNVYVNYLSPFWKVRVGDFKTQDQAQALRSQLIEAFPGMRSEIYIVREQIIPSGSK